MNPKLAHWLHLGGKMAFFVLAATSFYVIATASYPQYSEFVPGNIATLLSIATGVVFYMTIDGPLAMISGEFFAKRFDKDYDSFIVAEKEFISVIGIIMGLLLVITTSTSVWSGILVADEIVSPPTTGEVFDQVTNERSGHSASIELIRSELERARSTESERVRAAKERGHARVETAILSHPYPSVRESIRKQTWIMTSTRYKAYRDKVSAALADSTATVDAELALATTLQTQLTTTVATTESDLGALTKRLMDKFDDDQTDSDAKKLTWRVFLVLLQVFCAIASVSFSFLLAKYQTLYGQVIYPGRFSTVAAINRIGVSLTQRPLHFLHKVFDLSETFPTKQLTAIDQSPVDIESDNMTPGDILADVMTDPSKYSPVEKGRLALTLKEQGSTLDQIAALLGAGNRSTVHGWIKAAEGK